MRDGGTLVAEQLAAFGCRAVFCVPGESFLPVLEGLRRQDGIETVVCRQEGGAAMMAEAWGRLTGEPGVCIVTRAPGATNAASGVYVATHDGTPMLLLVGQVPRRHRGRGVFQELDYTAFFGGIAKWVAEADDPERLPELLARAWAVARNGRPGPVVLALPEDVLEAPARAAVVPAPAPAPARPDEAALGRVLDALARARRPLLLAGGQAWSARASERLAEVAGRLDLPVVVEFRCQHHLDNDHPCYAGVAGLGMDPALARRIAESDLVLAVGARLDDITTAGFRLLEPPRPRPRLIHVLPEPAALNRVFHADPALCAHPEPFLEALARAPLRPGPWAAWREAARADALAWRAVPAAGEAGSTLAAMMASLRACLPADAIVTNGAGNYAIWLHRHHRYGPFPSQLAPASGSMGYGLPAAIAARLAHPERAVLCLAGDGCLLMTGQELATAVRHRLALVVVVVDNGRYGTIRMHQMRRYGGAPFATTLANPDFVAWARAFGARAERATDAETFRAALGRALAHPGPSLIHVPVPPEVLAPGLEDPAPQPHPEDALPNATP
ncbi:thiamine pyrophosphate-dependent enzyme [Inmirania thermothiophila]|uniref:Acetolactate synthase large subunit n=1 Tax=Inmirania thermothiophila TaxID=1750597 RepID=A0A3N1Y4H7_9GAMM|nr:thiamine pyrophosphate-dependent enzyme [Inmirania thermothiophila]ROR32187.1 acetolactate synthase large subunit [Inmirania thermothiophila]